MAARKRTKKTLPDIVVAACKTRGVSPAAVKTFSKTNVDIFLIVRDRGEVRVEISALPAGVVQAHFAEPAPKTAVAQGDLPETA